MKLQLLAKQLGAQVREVRCAGDSVQDGFLQGLAASLAADRVETLRLWSCAITDASIPLWRSFSRLRVLDLYPDLEHVTLKTLREIGQLPMLFKLRVPLKDFAEAEALFETLFGSPSRFASLVDLSSSLSISRDDEADGPQILERILREFRPHKEPAFQRIIICATHYDARLDEIAWAKAVGQFCEFAALHGSSGLLSWENIGSNQSIVSRFENLTVSEIGSSAPAVAASRWRFLSSMPFLKRLTLLDDALVARRSDCLPPHLRSITFCIDSVPIWECSDALSTVRKVTLSSTDGSQGVISPLRVKEILLVVLRAFPNVRSLAWDTPTVSIDNDCCDVLQRFSHLKFFGSANGTDEERFRVSWSHPTLTGWYWPGNFPNVRQLWVSDSAMEPLPVISRQSLPGLRRLSGAASSLANSSTLDQVAGAIVEYCCSFRSRIQDVVTSITKLSSLRVLMLPVVEPHQGASSADLRAIFGSLPWLHSIAISIELEPDDDQSWFRHRLLSCAQFTFYPADYNSCMNNSSSKARFEPLISVSTLPNFASLILDASDFPVSLKIHNLPTLYRVRIEKATVLSLSLVGCHSLLELSIYNSRLLGPLTLADLAPVGLRAGLGLALERVVNIEKDISIDVAPVLSLEQGGSFHRFFSVSGEASPAQ